MKVILFQNIAIASEDDEDIDSDMAFGESPGPSDKTKVGPGGILLFVPISSPIFQRGGGGVE